MREDWIECTLREVCKIGSSKRILKKEYVSEGIPFYRTKEIKELSLGKEISIELYISNEKYNNIKNRFDIPKKGDVLISAVGTIGITYTIKNNEPFYFKDGNLIWLRDIQGLKSTFLNLGLTHFVRNSSILKTSGSAYNALTIEKLNSLSFPLPPLVEQKAIVKKIEELFSSLDSGIADLKKAQDQLVIYRQAVLKKAFEGELTKEWREKQTNLPSADKLLGQIKEERQRHYETQVSNWKEAVKRWKSKGANDKKPAKPKFIKELTNLTEEELENLPRLNKYWHWVKADKIASHEASSLKAGPFGSSLKKEFYTESGYKIYGQEQVIANNYKIGDYYVNQEKYDSLINCAVKPYDILISLVGTVGKVLVLPKDCEDGIINPRLVKISLNKFYDSIFFKYYFESAFLKSIYAIKAHGATMDILNLGIIKELPYPLCSKEEQHQIVLEIESRLSVCDNVEESIKESLQKAQALRQSILKKAFEGKLLSEEEIAKCKADAAYEPASVLLEKIKTEKRRSNGKKSN
jgi:type I restriction enzyme S subunit